jgi:RHS repeat-associated protein
MNIGYKIQNNQTKATYTYLADGVKAAVIGDDNKGFDYLGSFVYNNDNNVKTLESTNFGGGRINKTNNTYDINYFITDHLGSTRVIVNAIGEIKEQNNYYPFGKQWEYSLLMTSTNRWGYNGKEKQTIRNLNYLDYGARMYDSEIGRWFVQDPLAEKYYSISPYAYCMNNPIKAIDFDGRLVIFINGMYWGAFGEPSSGGQKYWEKPFNYFNRHVMNHLNDYNAKYVDGSDGMSGLFISLSIGRFYSNVSSTTRQNFGESKGKHDAPDIVSSITDENGNIKETIKIITHSMGAAFAKGYVKALVAYLKEHNIPLETIAFEADFAPYQPESQKAVKGVKTYQFSNFHDKTASNGWLLSPYGYIEGAEVHTSYDKNKGHSLTDFWEEVKSLPQGRYRIDAGHIVPD